MSAVASRVTSRMADLLRNGLGAPIIVLAMLAMVVLPLAPPVLDMLFSFNIALSLVVMLFFFY